MAMTGRPFYLWTPRPPLILFISPFDLAPCEIWELVGDARGQDYRQNKNSPARWGTETGIRISPSRET
jgi:hypothetical protein